MALFYCSHVGFAVLRRTSVSVRELFCFYLLSSLFPANCIYMLRSRYHEQNGNVFEIGKFSVPFPPISSNFTQTPKGLRVILLCFAEFKLLLTTQATLSSSILFPYQRVNFQRNERITNLRSNYLAKYSSSARDFLDRLTGPYRVSESQKRLIETREIFVSFTAEFSRIQITILNSRQPRSRQLKCNGNFHCYRDRERNGGRHVLERLGESRANNRAVLVSRLLASSLGLAAS